VEKFSCGFNFAQMTIIKLVCKTSTLYKWKRHAWWCQPNVRNRVGKVEFQLQFQFIFFAWI